MIIKNYSRGKERRISANPAIEAAVRRYRSSAGSELGEPDIERLSAALHCLNSVDSDVAAAYAEKYFEWLPAVGRDGLMALASYHAHIIKNERRARAWLSRCAEISGELIKAGAGSVEIAYEAFLAMTKDGREYPPSLAENSAALLAALGRDEYLYTVGLFNGLGGPERELFVRLLAMGRGVTIPYESGFFDDFLKLCLVSRRRETGVLALTFEGWAGVFGAAGRDAFAGVTDGMLAVAGRERVFAHELAANCPGIIKKLGLGGFKKITNYHARFTGAKRETVARWMEKVPDIASECGFEWLDELTGIYLELGGASDEFGPALLQKNNFLVKSAGPGPIRALAARASCVRGEKREVICDWLSKCSEVFRKGGEAGLARFAEATGMAPKNGGGVSVFLSGADGGYADFIDRLSGKVKLRDVRQVLEVYVEALLGFRTRIAEADIAFTDGEKIYLPAYVDEFGDAESNFALYKVYATHEEAHLEYGSFDFEFKMAADTIRRVNERYERACGDASCDIEKFCLCFPEPEEAKFIFNLMEDYRIECRLSSRYPVLGAQIRKANARLIAARNEKGSGGTGRRGALETLLQVMMGGVLSAPCSGGTASFLRSVLPGLAELRTPSGDVYASARLTASVYMALDDGFGGERDTAEPFTTPLDQSMVEKKIGNFRRTAREIAARLHPAGAGARDGRMKDLENDAEKLLWELFRKKGIKPNEVAEKIGRAQTAEASCASPSRRSRLVDYIKSLKAKITPEEKKCAASRAFLYPEWGDDIKGYRRRWARVVETSGDGPDLRRAADENKDEPCSKILKRLGGLIKLVKNEFGKLRARDFENISMQKDGSEIDLNAATDYFIDRKTGRTPSENCYRSRKRRKRNISVALLVDRSFSTEGERLGREKDALVIFAEALKKLGDDFAIYTFCGSGDLTCSFGIIKEFQATSDEDVMRKIANIEAFGSTPAGAAIRHATVKLNKREAKTKLLILLSDGLPNNTAACPVEDTRMALKEAQTLGIRSFCITIDRCAADYLPKMFSHSNWVVVDDVAQLPRKIAKIYRRLTA